MPHAPPKRKPRLLVPLIASGLAAVALAVALNGSPEKPMAAATVADVRPTPLPHPGAVTTTDALPPPNIYAPDPAGATMLGKLTLAPARSRTGATGYVVTKADAELLSATPLREGDVVLELDGQKLDQARIERLSDELGGYDDVWVSFERQGKRVETILELRRR